jgi:methionyl aminopeptidase
MKTYNKSELGYIRRAGEILSAAMLAAKNKVAPGVSTLDLDAVAESVIVQHGAEGCFKGYRGYGYVSCISVNEEVVHGTPRKDKKLKEGDIVSIDIGVRYNGFCADAARTFGVGKISKSTQELIDVTRRCFDEAIKNLKAGSSVGDIGRRVEYYIKHNTTYGILTNYFGHGIGRNVHEEPLIPNFVPNVPALRTVTRKKFPEHTVICIEPMICEGDPATKTKEDKWTVVMADGKLSAHYENTLIIHKDGVEVVTDKFI